MRPFGNGDFVRSPYDISQRESTLTATTGLTKLTENTFERPGSIIRDSEIDFNLSTPPSARPSVKHHIEISTLEKLAPQKGLHEEKASLKRQLMILRILIMLIIIALVLT